MEKPIIVTLGRGHADDLVEIIEDNGEITQRMGLCKHVDAQYVGKTFDSLVEYMLIGEEDELNKAYSQTETQLANAICAMRNSGGTKLIPKLDGEYIDNFTIDGESIISDYIERITERKELNVEGDTIPYDSIDLKIKAAHFGGIW